jgi:release factor glutamine methyltransferase
MTTIKLALQSAIKSIKQVSNSAHLDAELLLAKILKVSRVYLLTNQNQELDQESQIIFQKLVNRRSQSEPIAYILGYQEFFGLKLKVDQRALIPRADTEILVEQVLNFAAKLNQVAIVDLGTGSGAIALALKSQRPDFDILATDLESKTLSLAQENAINCKLTVKFQISDLLEEIAINNQQKNLVFTANLPYVQAGASLPIGVQHYEPALALFAGADGLEHYRRLFFQLKTRKLDFTALFLEADPGQASGIEELRRQFLPQRKSAIFRDLAGKKRVWQIY